MNILLLEDEINVGSTLKVRLEHEGWTIHWAQNLAQARDALKKQLFSLALLDVNLPDGTGFALAREIRIQSASTALIFLTAAGTPEDRVHGLELGAEDYVVKPFHAKELILRINNVLKRAQFVLGDLTPQDQVTIGRATIRFNQYELSIDLAGSIEKHHLSHKECALLKLLHDHRGTVVSRDDILNLIWSEDEFPTPRTIDNFILRLRKLVEPNPEVPSVIRSVRGVGYLMEKED
jgi:two-component system alkaline phosphatase synthesis response regulator PhoP